MTRRGSAGLLWQTRTSDAGRHAAHYMPFGLFRTPHQGNDRMVVARSVEEVAEACGEGFMRRRGV
jgi:hypothetical protein